MEHIRQISSWIDKIANWLAACALLLTFSMVLLNVILRYIFHSGFSWSEEGARYALVALIIFGIVEATHKQEHFSVDLLSKKGPKPIQKTFKILQSLVLIGVTCVFIKGSISMVILNWHNTTPAMHIPAWLPYMWLLISSIISFLHLIFHFLQEIIPQDHFKKSEDPIC